MDDIRRALVAGDLASAKAGLITRALHGAPASAEFARLAEAVGHSELAVQSWRGVLAAVPDDIDALEALVRLHTARGDERRAEECRRKLGRAAPVEVTKRDEPGADGEPTIGDLVRFVHLFGGRAGVHARMWRQGDDVGYSPVKAPLEPNLAGAHLRGEVTVGSYLVRHGDVVGQLVFDLDATREAIDRAAGRPERVAELARRVDVAGLALRERLVTAGVPCLLVDSGYKGRHAWVFLDPPADAGAARSFALRWAAALDPGDPDLRLEVFPKQAQVAEGSVGNLVKLPMGVHLKTGRRCSLLGRDGAPHPRPFELLHGQPCLPLAELPPPPLAADRALSPVKAASALPAVPVVGPVPFTEADFEGRPRLAALLTGCAVLRDVVERSVRDLTMTHDERVALENTLGHWPEGVEAVNWLSERVHSTERMGRPLQSNPASCKSLRRRLSAVAGRVGCDCPFDAPDTYPNPLLHARGVPAEAPALPPNLDELLETLGRLEERSRRVEAELSSLRAEAAGALRRVGRYRAVGGEWWVEEPEGIPIIRFVADPVAE